MSLIWIDGFDTYGTNTSANVSPSDILSRKYTDVSGTWRPSSARILGNGQSLFNYSYGHLRTPALTTDSKMILGIAIQRDKAAISYGSSYILYLYENTTERLYVIDRALVNSFRSCSSRLEVWLKGSPDTKVGEIYYNNHVWNYFELLTDTSAGVCTARLNGVQEFSESVTFTASIHNIIRLNGGGTGVARASFDDFYVCDGTGTKHNSFLGPRTVISIQPDADISGYTDWTPSTGSDHFGVVDEQVANDDTDYIYTSTANDTDLFSMDNVDFETVHGCFIYTDIRKESGDSDFNIRLPVRLSAVIDEGSSILVSETNYTGKYRLSESDPSSNDWTPSNIDAAQMGIKTV